jgi:hypothetical protein
MRSVSGPMSVHLEVSVAAPEAPDLRRLREEFFERISGLTLGLVRGEHWRLRAGPLTVLRFGEPVEGDAVSAWPITGGLATRRPGGWLAFGWHRGRLVGLISGYQPMLPRPVYRALQLPAHRFLTRMFLLRLRGRSPLPGVPAGTAQRLATAALDAALCAGITWLLGPRRRVTGFCTVALAYHTLAWTRSGRTPAGWVTGERLAAVDGGGVSLGQAVVRLAALPLALARLDASHDRVAGTEVLEAPRLRLRRSRS